MKSIAERHLTYAAFIVFIWGLFIKRTHAKERLFDWWLIAIIIFIFIAPEGSLGQEYYQLPFAIPAAVFAGKVFEKYLRSGSVKESFLKNKLAVSFLGLCLAAMLVLSFLRINNFMKSENYNAAIFKLKEDVKSVVPQEDLVVTLTEGNPTMLYL